MHHLTLVLYNYQRAYFARLKQKEDLCFLRISEMLIQVTANT